MTIGSETAPGLRAARYGGVTARGWQLIGLGLLVVAACLLPFLLSNYRIFQVTLALAYSIAVLGGFIVGVLENVVGAYLIGTELKLTVALVVIIGVLVVKPSGLFGRVLVSRV